MRQLAMLIIAQVVEYYPAGYYTGIHFLNSKPLKANGFEVVDQFFIGIVAGKKPLFQPKSVVLIGKGSFKVLVLRFCIKYLGRQQALQYFINVVGIAFAQEKLSRTQVQQ